MEDRIIAGKNMEDRIIEDRMLTWAWVNRTLLFLRCDRGNCMCCLASMEHPVRPPIWPGIPPMLLLGPLIRLETGIKKNNFQSFMCVCVCV